MPLVVIHYHHGVVHAAFHFGKNGVRRQRSLHLDGGGAGVFYRRCDFGVVLAAEQATLTAVGVQTGYGDAGGMDLQPLQRLVRQLDHAHPQA